MDIIEEDEDFLGRCVLYSEQVKMASNRIKIAEQFLNDNMYLPSVEHAGLKIVMRENKRARIEYKDKPLIEHPGFVRVIESRNINGLFERAITWLEEAIGE